MPPKHWCKHCKKSLPSSMSLGGHMNLHRGRRKKQPRSTPSPPSIGAGRGRYGLRERRQSTWWLSGSTSSDDETWTLVPEAECKLCFKVFASYDALSVVEHKASGKVAAWSNGDGSRNVTVSAAPGKKKRSKRSILGTVPTPLMMTYGIEDLDAACILLKLQGILTKYSASVDCHEDCEMDGDLAYHMQMTEMDDNLAYHMHMTEMDDNLAYHMHMTEMDMTSSDGGIIWETELIKPEYSCSDEEMKFGSLSHLLKAKTSHECKLCGKVFISGQALGGHMKGHNYPDHETVATFPKPAASQPRKQLLEVDRESLNLSLPALSDRDYSSSRRKSEINPWWVASSLRTTPMLCVV